MFDDDFTGCDLGDCYSSGPVAPDKRVRVKAQPCPVSSAVFCAPVHHTFVRPFRTGPPI